MASILAAAVIVLAAVVSCSVLPRVQDVPPRVQDIPPFPANGPPNSISPMPGRISLNKELLEAQKKQHTWERSGQYEGDILFPRGIKPANGIIVEAWKWKTLEVPYFIDPTFTANQRRIILSAINEYHSRTCIRFRPYVSSDPDYVYITGNYSGCYSYIGRVANGQILNLEYNGGCVFHEIVVHELLHALGFFHMQSTHNRDNYVTINWANIVSGMEHNFDSYSTLDFGAPYDYDSIMHYSRFAFTTNGQPTIDSKQGHSVLGAAKNLTTLDIYKLHSLYGCPT